MKIVYCLLNRDREQEFQKAIREHCLFFDKSIVILHQIYDENVKFLESEECKDLNIDYYTTDIPYDPKALRDLYMERLDKYMQEIGEQVWFLVLDVDEILELPALYTLKLTAQEAERQGFNIVGYNSHDIQTTPEGTVWENKSGYWNPNFNKHYPGMRYTPGTHIGIARPAPANMAKSPHRYFHVKTVGSQWIRGCRNYWTTAETAQNTTNSPLWQEFKALCASRGLETFDQIAKLLYEGTVPADLVQWFVMNRDSENSEARSWFVTYLVFLHPELNVGCAGNKDYAFDKNRKACKDLTF